MTIFNEFQNLVIAKVKAEIQRVEHKLQEIPREILDD